MLSKLVNGEMLHPLLVEKLHEAHARMQGNGELLPPRRLEECYSTFSERFGPDALRQLDGEQLLDAMHANGKRSLVYWLEFKIAGESSKKFGSISGRSAHKFGLFREKRTGKWITGSPQKKEELSVGDAIEIARRHRDQLVAGSDIISKLPHGAQNEEYLNLQSEMNQWAPDVSNTAWGHKYFSLMFPDKVDDFHVEEYQKFHSVKLLKRPPEGTGRYLAAGIFVRLAGELKWPLNHLTSVLIRVNGQPRPTWRIGINVAQGASGTIWPRMRDSGYVAIGWPEMGDLSGIKRNQATKTQIANSIRKHHDLSRSAANRTASEILNFAVTMTDGDPVLVVSGDQVFGLGHVTGPYRYDPHSHRDAPHQRNVEWNSIREFRLPTLEERPPVVCSATKSLDNLMDVESRFLDASTSPTRAKRQIGPTVRLNGIPGRIQSVLERKGQVVLYGPPGTGKTFWARQVGLDLAAIAAFGHRFEQLDAKCRDQVEGDRSQRGLLQMCTFHPAYGYEDFIEGYRPTEGQDGGLAFELIPGIFKQICSHAELKPELQFYLLIDEINRGDIPRIFGELLTLLEQDKRGKVVNLPVSGERFSVPKNVKIIGTMNTADRSIALLDTALRRRFGFIEMMPDPALLGDAVVADCIPLRGWLATLNERIRENIGRDARNLQVGHSYLMKDGQPITSFGDFAHVLADDIFPLLEEYCYEDYSTLARILGTSLVDESRQRVRYELMQASRRANLALAVQQSFPELGPTQGSGTETLEEDEAPKEGDTDSGANG